VQAVLAQLHWDHQLALLDKLPNPDTRRWYAAKTIEHNWSRNVLNIKIKAHPLAGNDTAVTSLEASLPKPQSDLRPRIVERFYRFNG
jgi:hypothetical protein